MNHREPRVGVLIDPGVVSEGLDVAAIRSILEPELPVAAASTESDAVKRAVEFIRANELNRLVVASLDVDVTRKACNLIVEQVERDPIEYRLVDVVRLCARVHPSSEATAKAFLLILAGAARLGREEPLSPANLGLESNPCGLRRERFDLSRLSGFRHADVLSHASHRRQALDGELEMLLGRRDLRPTLRIVAVACRGGMTALYKAGQARTPYPPSILPLEVPCVVDLDPLLVPRAFQLGADGVVLLGCSDYCRSGLDLTGLQQAVTILKGFLDACRVGEERLCLMNDGSPGDFTRVLNDFAARLAWP